VAALAAAAAAVVVNKLFTMCDDDDRMLTMMMLAFRICKYFLSYAGYCNLCICQIHRCTIL